jgi:pimeloyl-ACP methyl ester carboxylesterase
MARVFIGLSQAGALAVNFVTMYPHLVEKLILVGTTPMPMSDDVPWPIDRERWRERRAHARAGEYEKALQSFWADVFTEPGSRNLLEARIQADRETPRQAVENFFMSSATDPGSELRPLLPALRVPALVLHGDADQCVPVEAGRYLADRIPGAQFQAINGGCHAFFITRAAEFARGVRHFVRTGRA